MYHGGGRYRWSKQLNTTNTRTKAAIHSGNSHQFLLFSILQPLRTVMCHVTQRQQQKYNK